MGRRELLVTSIGLAWAALGAASAGAQWPAPIGTGASEPVQPTARTNAEVPSSSDDRLGNAWGIDLVLGLPAGIRVFHELGPPAYLVPELEAFAGLYLIVPMVGGGLRWQLAPLSGESNALILRPGVDGYLVENPFYHSAGWFSGGPHYTGLVAADVDLVWQHHFDRYWCGELGFKVGGGFVPHRRAPDTRTPVVPIGGIFLGIRY
jgi:hypothetical protein